MKLLRLAPDYSCYPIWHDDSAVTEDFGDIDPRSLPITDSLADDLISWSNWFDKGVTGAGIENFAWEEGEKDRFVSSGLHLLDRLREELGHEFIVRRGF
ncbi:hypothetical protein NHH82_20680 [Oxalobacteraceae bacterium OTU3REALA1]|nr:hypothetical protein NHH82_20680 [Oxalobacteraceae bacterium OTU3REALA1]